MPAADLNQVLQKRCPDNICAKCRRPFSVGDRITGAYILCDSNAYNPERLTERGLQLGTDCEFVHICCEDPQLDGKYAAQFRRSGLLT